MGKGLVTLRPHLSRSLQGIIGLPVLLAGRLLHEHERFPLQPPHQVMAHSRIAPGRVIAGIIIPGYNVHFLRPFEIVQPFISSHQIGSHRRFLIKAADCVPLHFKVL